MSDTEQNAELSFKLIAVDLLFQRLNVAIGQLERITKMQAWLLDRYAKHLLEHGIHQELNKAEAEAKRRTRYNGGGIKPEILENAGHANG